MFFRPDLIAISITELKNVHPFFGITFLTCKKEGDLPVGNQKVFQMDWETDKFLRQYHQIDPGSDWFFQPFKSIKEWVRPDYAPKGLQSINTQSFGKAFLHETNTRIWGWAPDYISILASKLPKNKKIPVFQLAVWLYKDKEWAENTKFSDIIDFFINDFHITLEEEVALFDISRPPDFKPELTFQQSKSSWNDLQNFLKQPPDAKQDQGGMLSYLETYGLGPAKHLLLEPADRLTLITGDNGLGKTFLLECAWFALTGEWAGMQASPNLGKKPSPGEVKENQTSITFELIGDRGKSKPITISYDWKTSSWPLAYKPTIPGLIIYARVDGSFAVWDPARHLGSSEAPTGANKYVFSSTELWDSKTGYIEGLIRDWVRWQYSPEKQLFETFSSVLELLSPPDLGKLAPGKPVRIPNDPRDIPTIKHPYGETAIVYASAGVRRIITLAYLVVWAWNEHVIASKISGDDPQRRLVVLIDEMEAHLHPRWQREVLPALMLIGEKLQPQLREVQFLVATHSPLVAASTEPIFNDETDLLVDLVLAKEGEVSLREMDFVRYGDVSSWLTSPIFKLEQARSSVAEKAIKDAKSIQLKQNATTEEVSDISMRLTKCLAADDKFWPRWITFAEKFGVIL
ncbi:MAG: AAA family ATPase [Geobacteraceae bacterium]|nr:AAA family ATPase [Geobacteraceae bacterium]